MVHHKKAEKPVEKKKKAITHATKHLKARSRKVEKPLEYVEETKEALFDNKYEILGAILVIALISLTYSKWPK